MFTVRMSAKEGEKKKVFYSTYVKRRKHAEKLLAIWAEKGIKPPLDEMAFEHPSLYAKISDNLQNISLEIKNTAKDELSYNGNDPRYKAEYLQRADTIVKKLDLKGKSK